MKGAMHSLWERARMDTIDAPGFMQASGGKTLASKHTRTKPQKTQQLQAQAFVILHVCCTTHQYFNNRTVRPVQDCSALN